MEAADLKQVGRRVSRGDGTPDGVRNGGGVVIEDGYGGMTNVMFLGQDVLVSHDACQFKIAVGQVTS